MEIWSLAQIGARSKDTYLDPGVPLVDAVVHRGRSIDLDTVIVDGDVVMLDRQLIKIDKSGLFKELKEALDRPLTPQKQDAPHQLQRPFLSGVPH